MQKLIIAGTVGRDAELRRTQGGDPVLGFSVAVDNGKDRDGNKRDATWYDASLWGKRAEALERHITKGLRVTLEGRPTAREHNGKVYLGISVNDLTFQGGGEQRSAGGYDNSGYGAGGQPSNGGYNDLEDGIPFLPVTLI